MQKKLKLFFSAIMCCTLLFAVLPSDTPDITGNILGSETVWAASNSNVLLIGDVDQNGSVNALDFAKYRQFLLGMISSVSVEADIDQDGKPTALDFAQLRLHLLGKITLKPIVLATPTPIVTPTPVSTPKGTIVIMPLGDSITDGLTVPGGYRIKLWEKIQGIGAKVDFVGSMSNGPSSLGDKNHEGHSGWTISQIDQNINAWMDKYTPEIVLLHIGTNDIYMSPNGASDRLSTLIDKICAKLPEGGKLYVANIIPLGMGNVTSYNSTIPGIVQQKATQGKPVYFVEMYKALTTADLADGVHPNTTGYNKMAEVWFNAIKSDLTN